MKQADGGLFRLGKFGGVRKELVGIGRKIQANQDTLLHA